MAVLNEIKDQLAHPTHAWTSDDVPSARFRLQIAAAITGGLTLAALLVSAGYFLGYLAAA